jgi:dipeptidyl aminopeptidase/acylaminoacyl peptidase
MGMAGRHIVRAIVTLLVGVVAFGVIYIVLLSWLAADDVVHPAMPPTSRTPAEFGQVYEEVAFETEDGIQIRGWWLPPDDPSSPAVIVQPGHNSNRGDVITHTMMMAEHGYGVLTFDWRATGESGGDTSTVGLTETRDALAALDWLEARTDFDTRRIGALGQSMGAAAFIHAAAQDPRISAVAAETTFASLDAIVESGLGQKTGLPTFPFARIIVFLAQVQSGYSLHDNRPVDSIGAIAPRPVLIIRGGADRWALSHNADQLYAAAGEPKELWDVPGATHSNVMEADPAGYEERVVAFFDAALRPSRGE